MFLLPKMRVSLIITVLFFVCLRGFSQKNNRISKNSTFGGSIGSTTYYGDVSPYRYPFRGILKSTSFNANLEYATEINEKWGRSIKFQFSELVGDDNKYNENTSSILSSMVLRNMHFRNRIFQLNYNWRYYLTDNQATISRRRNSFNPFLSMGLGFIYTNPQARENYNQKLGEWVNLRPLHTTNPDKSYSPVWINVPVGIGVIKKLSRKWDFKAQATFNLPFTDYLDDVSRGKYLSSESYKNEKAYNFHIRMFDPIDPLTGQNRIENLKFRNIEIPDKEGLATIPRGTKSTILSAFDLYVTTEFGFHYWLDWKIR